LNLSDNLVRIVDVSSKLATALAVIIGAIVGVGKYVSTRSTELRINKLEAQKPVLQERLNVCLDVSSAAAMIATSDDDNEVAEAKRSFWKLYWGPLGITGDLRVYGAATRFAACLNDQSKCSPSIKELSWGLALNCRTSLGADWGMLVPPPTNLKVIYSPNNAR
jgi:hypothetical protein